MTNRAADVGGIVTETVLPAAKASGFPGDACSLSRRYKSTAAADTPRLTLATKFPSACLPMRRKTDGVPSALPNACVPKTWAASQPPPSTPTHVESTSAPLAAARPGGAPRVSSSATCACVKHLLGHQWRCCASPHPPQAAGLTWPPVPISATLDVLTPPAAKSVRRKCVKPFFTLAAEPATVHDSVRVASFHAKLVERV